MNNGKQSKIVKIIKLIILVGFIIGVSILAVYPVDDQAVSLDIYTYIGNVSSTYSAEEIKEMQEFLINFPGIGEVGINEIRFRRKFDSICVDKITADSIDNYVTITEDTIVFNNVACDLLRRNSQSYLAERLIYAEVLFIFVLALWILINSLDEKYNLHNNNHGPMYEIRKFCNELIRYKSYMVYAANADLKAEVANSYLNRLWWLLEPFFNMLVYVVVFGRVMGNSVQNYATFVFSALLMWTFFSKIINYSVKCIRNNKDIVTKVYVPKHILLISNMILNFFKLLFSMIVLVPMLFIFHVHVGISVLWIISAYVLMILLSFGVGMIFLHYGVYVDDLSYAVGILLQMLMFLSGMFYDVIMSLAEPLNVMVLCLNPVAMFVDTMRNALLNNMVTNVPLIGIWIVLSLLISYIGIHIVYKHENGYVKVV